jgi:ribosomal-protein-alanine N-acetyltransferase
MTVSSAEQYELHRMRSEHLDQILRIERMSFSNPWPRESFLSDLRSPHARCLVAVAKGSVIGYAIGWFVLDELHVLNLAVEPQQRRRGVGQRLLRDLLTAAGRRGCRTATLELRSSNTNAGKLYQKYGFRPVAQRKNYYRRPTEDAVVMLLDLNSADQLSSSGLEVADGVVSES